MPTALVPGTGSLPLVWAPGRVNLIGEHTDYSGGLVLPAAIQLGITLRVDAVADDVRLDSSRFGPADPFGADGGGPASTGWARYGQGVAAELSALGRPAVGLVGTVESDLPPGAGLSSSAALEVAIGLALCTVAEFELEPLQLALACQRAELRAVGVPCGILDQAACLLGQRRLGTFARLLDARAPPRLSPGAGGVRDRRLGRRAQPRDIRLRRAAGRARACDASRRGRAVHRRAPRGPRPARFRPAAPAAPRRDGERPCPSLRGGARGRRVGNGRNVAPSEPREPARRLRGVDRRARPARRARGLPPEPTVLE